MLLVGHTACNLQRPFKAHLAWWRVEMPLNILNINFV